MSPVSDELSEKHKYFSFISLKITDGRRAKIHGLMKEETKVINTVAVKKCFGPYTCKPQQYTKLTNITCNGMPKLVIKLIAAVFSATWHWRNIQVYFATGHRDPRKQKQTYRPWQNNNYLYTQQENIVYFLVFIQSKHQSNCQC